MEQQHRRHDGTSPLPFAMDWSHPPFKWNGRNTMWPQDSHIGWRYCVTIPTWVITPQATDMDPVLFYRVQVGLQSPKGITTTRTILRKFNDFLELRVALRNMFPSKNLPPTPPKQMTRGLNVKFFEKRQQTMEDWIIRLLSDFETSRSMVVATFFELESAAKSSFRDENQQIASGGMPLNSDLTDALERLDTHEELETTKWKSRENLQQAILERERLTQMQCDMDELQRKLLDMELKLESQKGDKTKIESSTISPEKDQVLHELEVTRNKFKHLLKKHQELEAKSKADVIVLVKEVKSLRSTQAQLTQQLNESLEEKSNAEKLLQQEKLISEKEKADRMKLIHDWESLHNRLLECRVNLLNESADSICNNSSSLQSAFELLQISDYQIEILLAEAHFLLQDDKQEVSAMTDISKVENCGTAVDYELKNVLSKILIDNITLQKIVSSVVHYALKVSSSTGKDDAEIPADN
uniref:PX domain-containing protein n=2 Tax=Tanacetum cinerariifolium TaxID=118510 RepID=A0A6L2J1A1_TANCI|nr:hypothetical protein [Tanacetum cinerariifolium]